MGLLLLLIQSVCMFGASFIVGSIPLSFKSAMSGKRLKAISVLGMGLLVGAALTIIIPEGVSTLFEALPENDQSHQESAVHAMGLSLLCGFSLMLLIESLIPHPPHPAPQSPSYTTPVHSPQHSPSPSTDEPLRPSNHHQNSQTPMIQKPKRMSVDECEVDLAAQASSIHGLNATLGLVIHGAADGIALGASSLAGGGNGSLGLVVFFAVLVHKGPTALGLTTTLLSLQMSTSTIRKRLTLFSFAAPIGAIITYLLVSLFGSSSAGGAARDSDGDALGWWTGIALLFSGGSFLYVATVIQPLSSATDSHDASNHSDHVESGHGGPAPSDDGIIGKYQRTALLAVGMGAPMALSLLVGDVH